MFTAITLLKIPHEKRTTLLKTSVHDRYLFAVPWIVSLKQPLGSLYASRLLCV
jgi:hypothetical protein